MFCCTGSRLHHARLVEQHVRLCLLQVRGRGAVDLLLRRRLARQALLAGEVGLALYERGLGRVEVRLRHLQRGGEVLLGDLGAELLAGELRLCRVELALRLVARVHELARVDVDQRLALAHELVVGDVERDDASGDARRDLDRAPVGIGVVRVLGIEPRKPPVDAAEREQDDDDDGDEIDLGPALLARFLVGALLLVLLVLGPVIVVFWRGIVLVDVLALGAMLAWRVAGRRILTLGEACLVLWVATRHRDPAFVERPGFVVAAQPYKWLSAPNRTHRFAY